MGLPGGSLSFMWSLLMRVRTKDPKHGDRTPDLSVMQAMNKGSYSE